MLLSCSAKKVTKERGQRGATKMRPLWYPPPHRQPTPENVPIFGRLQRENLQALSGRCSKIGTFLDTGWRCGGEYQRGRIFVAPLWSPSFGTFLGEARKVHNTHPYYRNVYLLKKHRSKERYFFATRACKPGSVLTAIYLAPQLLAGSSRLHGTAGSACCPSTALLRDRVYIVRVLFIKYPTHVAMGRTGYQPVFSPFLQKQ